MATAGPNAPGTAATEAWGGRDWTNPNNAKANDGVFATAAEAASATTYLLKLTNLGFAITAGATIVGVTVVANKKASHNAAGSNYCTDNRVQLIVGGTRVGDNYKSAALYPTSAANSTYGGAADLWGTTLTVAQVNATDFGMAIATNIFSAGPSVTASIDYVTITIDYTVAASGVPKHSMHYARMRR